MATKELQAFRLQEEKQQICPDCGRELEFGECPDCGPAKVDEPEGLGLGDGGDDDGIE